MNGEYFNTIFVRWKKGRFLANRAWFAILSLIYRDTCNQAIHRLIAQSKCKIYGAFTVLLSILKAVTIFAILCNAGKGAEITHLTFNCINIWVIFYTVIYYSWLKPCLDIMNTMPKDRGSKAISKHLTVTEINAFQMVLLQDGNMGRFLQFIFVFQPRMQHGWEPLM